MMEFISLVPLWWLLPLLALVGYAYRRTLSDRPKRWRRLSFAFRCLDSRRASGRCIGIGRSRGVRRRDGAGD